MTEIQLTVWDPSTLPVDATILLVGRRNTGKTTLTRDLMYHMRNRLDLCCGFSPTEMANGNLSFFMPPALVYHGFSDEKLAHILEWQRRCVANDRAMKLGLILDDCMSEQTAGASGKGKKKVMQSNDINKVFKMGRHLKLFFINAMQYIRDAPPDIRGNVDLLFAFNTSSGTEREKLWREYFGMFSTYKDFCRVFEACTGGYDCIVLDTRQKCTKPTDAVHYYRAACRTEPFRVGRPIFYGLSEHFFEDRTDYSMDPLKVLGGRSSALLTDGAAGAGSSPQRKRRGDGEITIIKRPAVEDPGDEDDA